MRQAITERIESLRALDAPGKAVGKAVRGVLGPGALKDAISGTWLGHALHPVLTDVTIGSFTSASLLDVLGGDRDGSAAERLIAVGLASYGPTALTGVSDWADSEVADDHVRRVGLVHASTNATAFTLFASSLHARRAGADRRGKMLGLAGVAALSAGGYLGGHMSFVKGVGPNQTAHGEVPEDWTAIASAGDLEPGKPISAVAGEIPVFVLSHGDGLHALHDWCSHRGCSLSEGDVEGEIVTCPCHGSQFDMRDGTIQRGPATAPQPVYDVREHDGQIEVRARAS